MAEKYGGGAESYARFKQYDYRAVSIMPGQSSEQPVLLHARRSLVPLLLLQPRTMLGMQSS
jgi:hypothetical protein